MWPKTKEAAKSAVKWANGNRLTAGIIAVIFLFAVASAVGAYRYRSLALDAAKAEREKAAEAEALKRENELQAAAFQSAIGATDPRLGQVLTEIRTVKRELARVEAERKELWQVPAVDNGELVARFERALEALR